MEVWRGDKLQEITDNFIHSITQLLEKTKVKICVSQIISTGRYYPEFNEKAKTLNDFVSSFICDLLINIKTVYSLQITTSWHIMLRNLRVLMESK